MKRPGRASHTSGDSLIYPKHYEFVLGPLRPVWAHVTRYPAVAPWEFDIHGEAELGVVLTGEQERGFEGVSFPACPGDVWLAAMWEPHGYRVVAPNTKVVCVHFPPEYLEDEMLGDIPWISLFAMPPAHRPRVSDGRTRAQTLGIARQLEEEVAREPLGWQQGVRLNMLSILLTLRRVWRPSVWDSSRAHGYANGVARFMPVIAELRTTPSRQIHVEDAAAKCGLSASHFRRVFRRTMGVSFGQFCLRARLAFAAHLLTTTELTAEAVAEQAGFTDASHLHHAFVKQHGCTPAGYRRRFAGSAKQPLPQSGRA